MEFVHCTNELTSETLKITMINMLRCDESISDAGRFLISLSIVRAKQKKIIVNLLQKCLW